MSDINVAPNGDIKSKVAAEAKPRVKVKHLTPAKTREFNHRMGLSNSYLVIGNKIKDCGVHAQAYISADLSDRTLIIEYPVPVSTRSNTQRQTEAIS